MPGLARAVEPRPATGSENGRLRFVMLTGLFVKMSNGATYSIVPFVNKRAVGAVAGIVGAGGNLGAVMAGFLFKSASFSWQQAFLILGVLVAASSSLAFLVKFSEAEQKQAASSRAEVGVLVPVGATGD